MRANRRVSGAEVRFRQALWAAGARGFRRGERLPGRPDVVFPAVRLALFVHGCFWHRCPSCALPEPRANAGFWRAKFEANAERDRRVAEALAVAGWEVQTVWEHELRADLGGTAVRMATVVTQRRESRGRPHR
jgi:DNA mismatch endonuclease (patch repair protein)